MQSCSCTLCCSGHIEIDNLGLQAEVEDSKQKLAELAEAKAKLQGAEQEIAQLRARLQSREQMQALQVRRSRVARPTPSGLCAHFRLPRAYPQNALTAVHPTVQMPHACGSQHSVRAHAQRICCAPPLVAPAHVQSGSSVRAAHVNARCPAECGSSPGTGRAL